MADKKSGEGLGITGFTLGILSIALAGWIGLLIAILGFIFCVVQQKRNKTSLGKAGIILNIIGFVISLAFIILVIFFPQVIPSSWNDGFFFYKKKNYNGKEKYECKNSKEFLKW